MRPHTANNVGLLRLCFAAAVIVGHAPELVDGDRAREPLTRLFGTVSLGEAAVDGFFLLSGYLITRSMAGSAGVGPFLARRVLRIYPAFLVASLLSVFALGPLVGAEVWGELPRTALRILALREPMDYPGQFPGLRTYPILNGSMWTISYEFRCYLLVAALGAAGLLARRRAVLLLALAMLALSALATYEAVAAPLARLGAHAAVDALAGRPRESVRLTAVFLVGVCAFLFEPELRGRIDGRAALGCGLACALVLDGHPHLAELGLVLLGGAVLHWAAFTLDAGPLQRVNDRWDISYGTYLYGWPLTITLVWRVPGLSPWAVAAIALPGAALAGAASWWGLERWAKDLVPSRSARDRPPAGATQPSRDGLALLGGEA